ncbi:CBS domain-containing protein [Streptosporangiaceae bacterium NEAU-GS5]|nr:CBS domain-containing protein [Streptosporangiaceae bacterium NEAU-GS5]
MRTKVTAVMTTDVVSVNGSTPFKDIAEAIITHEVSALPVVDAENHVIGIVSEADLLTKEEFREQYYREGYHPPLRTRLRHRLSADHGTAQRKAAGETAAELMTSPAITVTPETITVTAARLMDEHGVKRLVVVDEDGHLAGIVSRRDLLKLFVRRDADIAREVRDDVLERTLWVETAGVKVSVHQGIVTLSGRMARHSETLIAARMTGRVSGVVDVINQLDWNEEDEPKWGGR